MIEEDYRRMRDMQQPERPIVLPRSAFEQLGAIRRAFEAYDREGWKSKEATDYGRLTVVVETREFLSLLEGVL